MSASDVRVDLPLSYYVETVWRKRLLVAAFMAAGLALALAAYLSVTPLYEVTSLVIASRTDVERDTGAGRPHVEAVNSLSKILESEEVIRAAIERVGLAQVLRRPAGGRLFGFLPVGALPSGAPPEGTPAGPEAGDVDAAVRQVTRRLSVATEPTSEVVKLVYRDASPTLAAAFANAVTQAFIAKYAELHQRPGAVDFFRRQKARFEGEVSRLSGELEAFAKQEKTYAVDDQRALLLRRASDAAAALGGTRASLADKQGQREALTAQLKLLKPVTQSTFVSGLVDSLGAEARSAAPQARPGEARGVAGDPPLLMVRVYQDAMVTLFKVNAEIAGVQLLAQAQAAELDAISGELDGLAKRQIEFERRKRDLALATYNLDLYAKRAVDEQIDAELQTASFSNLRVVQKAFVPLQPAFPRGSLFMAAGAVLGLVLGALAAVVDDLYAMAFDERMRRLGGILRARGRRAVLN